MLDFFTNRIAVAQLVGLLFAALAAFHFIVPVTVNPANTIAVIVLAATAVSAILRFSHPGEPGADAKVWWQSRTIWVQIIAASFAGATLIGYAPKTDEAHVLETVMTLVALVSMGLGKNIAQPISGASGMQCAPLAVAGAVLVALLVGGCAGTGGIPISTPAQGLYAALGSYDAAVKSAADYAELPTANPTIVHKIKGAKDDKTVQAAVGYARVYAACQAKSVGTAIIPTTHVMVDCSLFNFTSNTALGYASTLNTVVAVLIQATGGVK